MNVYIRVCVLLSLLVLRGGVGFEILLISAFIITFHHLHDKQTEYLLSSDEIKDN